MSPIYMTNAHCNRVQALRMLKANISPQTIADEFPEVFECVHGCLKQRYDDDATACLHRTDKNAKALGVKETNYNIHASVVDALLKEHS